MSNSGKTQIDSTTGSELLKQIFQLDDPRYSKKRSDSFDGFATYSTAEVVAVLAAHGFDEKTARQAVKETLGTAPNQRRAGKNLRGYRLLTPASNLGEEETLNASQCNTPSYNDEAVGISSASEATDAPQSTAESSPELGLSYEPQALTEPLESPQSDAESNPEETALTEAPPFVTLPEGAVLEAWNIEAYHKWFAFMNEPADETLTPEVLAELKEAELKQKKRNVRPVDFGALPDYLIRDNRYAEASPVPERTETDVDEMRYLCRLHGWDEVESIKTGRPVLKLVVNNAVPQQTHATLKPTALAPSTQNPPSKHACTGDEEESVLDAALAYAAMGLKVFPLVYGQKVTAYRFSWTAEATSDAEKIKLWFDKGQVHNLGLLGGVMADPDYRVVVIDIDVKPAHRDSKGKWREAVDARGAFKERVATLGELPQTRTHATASGAREGRHYIFKYPSDKFIDSHNAFDKVEGFDIKSIGGYVVLPPSMYAGNQYTVIDDSPIAELPEAWIDYLSQSAKDRKHTEGNTYTPEELKNYQISPYMVDGSLSVFNAQLALLDPDLNEFDWKGVIGRAAYVVGGYEAVRDWSMLGKKWDEEAFDAAWIVAQVNPLRARSEGWVNTIIKESGGKAVLSIAATDSSTAKAERRKTYLPVQASVVTPIEYLRECYSKFNKRLSNSDLKIKMDCLVKAFQSGDWKETAVNIDMPQHVAIGHPLVVNGSASRANCLLHIGRHLTRKALDRVPTSPEFKGAYLDTQNEQAWVDTMQAFLFGEVAIDPEAEKALLKGARAADKAWSSHLEYSEEAEEQISHVLAQIAGFETKGDSGYPDQIPVILVERSTVLSTLHYSAQQMVGRRWVTDSRTKLVYSRGVGSPYRLVPTEKLPDLVVYVRKQLDLDVSTAKVRIDATKLIIDDLPSIEFANSPRYAPAKNGYYDIEEKTLHPYTPDGLKFNWCLNLDYDATATCPRWIAALAYQFEDDPAAIEVIRAFIRCMLAGNNTAQKYLEVIGHGGSGKSMVTTIISSLVHDDSVVYTDLKSLEEKNAQFEVGRLMGKKLTVMPDQTKFYGDSAKLRGLTGRDKQSYRLKHLNVDRDFIYDGMIMITANMPMAAKSDGGAILRRRIPITIDKVITEEQLAEFIDSECGDLTAYILKNELSGVLNWVLGMDVKTALKTLRTTTPATQAKNLEIEANNNPHIRHALERFVECESGQETPVGKKIPNSGLYLSNASVRPPEWGLYQDYCTFCEGENVSPLNRVNWIAAMQTYYKRTNHTYIKETRRCDNYNKYVISGIRLVSNHDE